MCKIQYNDLELSFFEKIDECTADWKNLHPDDFYWSPEYLKSIEEKGPSGIRPFYCVVTKLNKPEGLLYFQRKRINLAESIKIDNEKWYKRLYKKILLSNLNMETLVSGNMLLTGKYGFHFKTISGREAFETLDKIIAITINYLAKNDIKPGPVLLKDFFDDEVSDIVNLGKFIKFNVQPNMIMSINQEWNKMTDYENALKSKARIRYKRARSKFQSIQSREFQYEDLVEYKDEMNELYRNIISNVNFNLFYLNTEYFSTLKKNLGDKFIVNAYFKNEKLIGFNTALINHNHLDAHFLGYDSEINKESQLYLNMLYDLIEIGIEHKLSSIFMSRTAIEIKSSVGAKANSMSCFLMHTNSILNKLTRYIVGLLYKDENWIERNPFR